jgi:hypothetical protein
MLTAESISSSPATRNEQRQSGQQVSIPLATWGFTNWLLTLERPLNIGYLRGSFLGFVNRGHFLFPFPFPLFLSLFVPVFFFLPYLHSFSLSPFTPLLFPFFFPYFFSKKKKKKKEEEEEEEEAEKIFPLNQRRLGIIQQLGRRMPWMGGLGTAKTPSAQ